MQLPTNSYTSSFKYNLYEIYLSELTKIRGIRKYWIDARVLKGKYFLSQILRKRNESKEKYQVKCSIYLRDNLSCKVGTQ